MLNKITVIQNKKQTTFKGEELEEICAKNVLVHNTNLDYYKPSDFGYDCYLDLLKAIIYDREIPHLTDRAIREYGADDQVLLNNSLFENYEEEIGLISALNDAFYYSRSLLRDIGA